MPVLTSKSTESTGGWLANVFCIPVRQNEQTIPSTFSKTNDTFKRNTIPSLIQTLNNFVSRTKAGESIINKLRSLTTLIVATSKSDFMIDDITFTEPRIPAQQKLQLLSWKIFKWHQTN